MNKNPRRAADPLELRRRAEERLKIRLSDAQNSRSEAETQRLLHELQVHQIELEMQNDELCSAQEELETALANYTDLYDFAPTGYFTLARDGTILAVNLTGARLVGIERGLLLNRHLTSLVFGADQRNLNALLEMAFTGIARGSCEVMLQREGTTTFFVRIEAAPSANGQECRAAMLDVTERHEMECQRNQLIQDLQAAAARIKVLSGMLPICCYCKKIRDDRGYWEEIERYISDRSETLFSHGICPECMKQQFPDYLSKPK